MYLIYKQLFKNVRKKFKKKTHKRQMGKQREQTIHKKIYIYKNAPQP